MKCVILIAVLAALVACNDAAAVAVQNAAVRSDLVLGSRVPGDRLLYSQIYRKDGDFNGSQIEFVNYQGSFSTTITGIFVREVGESNGASAAVLRGGIGWNNVQIVLQSRRFFGFHYSVVIYGL